RGRNARSCPATPISCRAIRPTSRYPQYRCDRASRGQAREFRGLRIGSPCAINGTRAAKFRSAESRHDRYMIRRLLQSARLLEDIDAVQAIRRLGDRKSTRLNSSHVKISYAVFCLKKKK